MTTMRQIKKKTTKEFRDTTFLEAIHNETKLLFLLDSSDSEAAAPCTIHTPSLDWYLYGLIRSDLIPMHVV